MAEFGNGLTEESLLDSDPGHPELEDPGVGDEEPGLEEGEASIEDPVSEGHCLSPVSPHGGPGHAVVRSDQSVQTGGRLGFSFFLSLIEGHMQCGLLAVAWSTLTAIVVHAVQ